MISLNSYQYITIKNPTFQIKKRICGNSNFNEVEEKKKVEVKVEVRIFFARHECHYKMGSDDYDDEKPPHTVYLDGYWIGKYEVTCSQYDRYCDETGKQKLGDEGWGRGKLPVIYVSWDDANAYCQWLSKKTGLKFKLPTEAQWEKAARGIDNRKYPWGNNELDETLANYGFKVGKISPVGSYPQGASPYGLLDMTGNVWEWCSDWYDNNYYQTSPEKNPTGPKSGSSRVVRGGSWSYTARYLRCAYRYRFEFSLRYHFLGFRLCQDDK